MRVPAYCGIKAVSNACRKSGNGRERTVLRDSIDPLVHRRVKLCHDLLLPFWPDIAHAELKFVDGVLFEHQSGTVDPARVPDTHNST